MSRPSARQRERAARQRVIDWGVRYRASVDADHADPSYGTAMERDHAVTQLVAMLDAYARAVRRTAKKIVQ